MDIVSDVEGSVKKKLSRIVSELLDGATPWKMDEGKTNEGAVVVVTW